VTPVAFERPGRARPAAHIAPPPPLIESRAKRFVAAERVAPNLMHRPPEPAHRSGRQCKAGGLLKAPRSDAHAVPHSKHIMKPLDGTIDVQGHVSRSSRSLRPRSVRTNPQPAGTLRLIATDPHSDAIRLCRHVELGQRPLVPSEPRSQEVDSLLALPNVPMGQVVLGPLPLPGGLARIHRGLTP
jgi:hypothetical protein